MADPETGALDELGEVIALSQGDAIISHEVAHGELTLTVEPLGRLRVTWKKTVRVPSS